MTCAICPEIYNCTTVKDICIRLSGYNRDICYKCAHNVCIVEVTYMTTREFHKCRLDNMEHKNVQWCRYFCGSIANYAWYVFQKGYNGQPTLYWL